MRRWDHLVDCYLEEYAAAGRAATTSLGIRRELDRLGQWLKNRRPRPHLEEVNSDLLIAYIRARSAFHSKATLSAVISKMRGMGEFLTREGVWISNPLRWMRGPKLDPYRRLPRRISPTVMTEIWETAVTKRSGFSRWLWVAVLGVLYGTGARRGEIERLDTSDWDRENGVLRLDGRKTGRERSVPVPALTYQCLEAYLPRRQNHLASVGVQDEQALFVNRRGCRLSGTAISSGIKNIATRCGHKQVTLHQFRHTCASDLLEGGTRLHEVQRLLGHQTLQTTLRYVQIADPQLHESMQLHPINEFLSAGGDR